MLPIDAKVDNMNLPDSIVGTGNTPEERLSLNMYYSVDGVAAPDCETTL